MATIKFTKNELRDQQLHLQQLEKYLPTLQLKKAMLQAEVVEAKATVSSLDSIYQTKRKYILGFCELLSTQATVDPTRAIVIKQIRQHTENIAGVEVPYFDGIEFEEFSYNLFETPAWIDAAVIELRELASLNEQVKIGNIRLLALEKEWREVSIRVNLFEKILIPRAVENIRTIKIFLSDQQLSAVCRAKVAKAKINAQKAQKNNEVPNYA